MNPPEQQLCRECNNPMQALHCETIHSYRHWLCRWDSVRLFRNVWYTEKEWIDYIMSPEMQAKMKKDKAKERYMNWRKK